MNRSKCFVCSFGMVLMWILVMMMLGFSPLNNVAFLSRVHAQVKNSFPFFGEQKEKPEVLPRSIVLTVEEESNVKKCVEAQKNDVAKSNKEFWVKDVPMKRFTAHTYLKELSMVIDIGGNKGSDAEEFMNRYKCRVIIFEPLPTFISKLQEKFDKNPSVKVVGIGLGKEDKDVAMDIAGKEGDGSTLYSGNNAGSNGEVVKIRNVTSIFEQIGLGKFFVDLLHVDCEGCESDVLESIIATNIIWNIRHLQFATHLQYKGVREAVKRYCQIQEVLKRTHQISYQYKFVWESWELKG